MKLLFIQISNTEGIAAPLTDDCIKLLQDSIAIRIERNWDGIVTTMSRLNKNLSMSIIDSDQILPVKTCKEAILKDLQQKKQKLTTEMEELDKHVEEVSKV